jgi:hypothetical protein
MGQDNRIPSALAPKNKKYDEVVVDFTSEIVDERPTRDQPRRPQTQNSNNLTGKIN